MAGPFGRLIRRLEDALWQDLHPLHSGYFATLVACGGLAVLATIAFAAWLIWLR